MRSGGISKAIGVAVIAVLALSACSGNSGEAKPTSSQGSSKAATSATVVEDNGFTSFNAEAAQNNADVNGKIGYATHSGFGYIDNNLKVVKNEKFGKIEKLSDEPLTVKYTINDGVKWSDGAPVEANDLVLQWAASSAYYNDSNPAAKTGTAYFLPGADTSGLSLTSFPEIADNGRSMTIKYAKPYADWEIAIGVSPNVRVPAHIVAQKAGLKDATALTELLKNLPKGDPAKPAPVNERLKKVADFWNTGFDAQQLPKDPSLFLSNGPYIVRDIQPGQSITLVRNKDYSWGPAPKLEQITVRFVGNASDQVQALATGDADVISPQASTDIVEKLQALSTIGVTTDKGNQLSYEHLDLNFTGPFAEPSVRTAFLKTVPRNDIVNSIVKPLDSEAKPLDSQLFVPTQAEYAGSVQSNGSATFQNVDIEGAKQLLNGATPTIRILYNKDAPSRRDAFTLIAQSATQAGFNVVDGGLAKSEWIGALGAGSYDASIFGWSNSGVGVSNVPQVFKTNAGSNFNGFSSPTADQLMDQLVTTTDKVKQAELRVQIDKLIWDSGYGLPLFQTIGVDAFSSRVTGIKYNPTQTGVWWNVWEWAGR